MTAQIPIFSLVKLQFKFSVLYRLSHSQTVKTSNASFHNLYVNFEVFVTVSYHGVSHFKLLRKFETRTQASVVNKFSIFSDVKFAIKVFASKNLKCILLFWTKRLGFKSFMNIKA